MKSKQVYMNGEERSVVITMISMEIQSNIECESMGVEPAYDTKMLKGLYKKLTGFEWRAN